MINDPNVAFFINALEAPRGIVARLDERIRSSRALAGSDAFHAQELPKLEADRAAIVELVDAARRADRFIANLPTDDQLDAVMRDGDTGRKLSGALTAALAKFASDG